MSFNTESIPFIFIGIIILCGNSFVCLLYYKHAVLRTITNKFVVSVAACDMMIAVIFIPLYILSKQISGYVAALSSFGSLLNLLALTYERHIAVFHALRYYEILSQLRVRLLMIEVWTTTIIITLFPLPWELTMSSGDYQKWHKIYKGILTTIIILVISFTLFVYLRIFKVNRHHVQIEANMQSMRFSQVFRGKEKPKRKHVLERLLLPARRSIRFGHSRIFGGRSKSESTDLSILNGGFDEHAADPKTNESIVEDSSVNSLTALQGNFAPGRKAETTFSQLSKDATFQSSKMGSVNENGKNEHKVEKIMVRPIVANDEGNSDRGIASLNSSRSKETTCSYAGKLKRRASYQKSQAARIIIREIKAAKIIALIFIVNCLCWLPIIIINICDVISPQGQAFISPTFLNISLYFFVLNSLLNPFIYAICKKDFRKVIARRLRLLRLQFQ